MRIVWAIQQDIVGNKKQTKKKIKRKKKPQIYFYITKSETKKVIPLIVTSKTTLRNHELWYTSTQEAEGIRGELEVSLVYIVSTRKARDSYLNNPKRK